ncbi:MAG: heparinase II/III family protein, partial [Armatimonadota bacterium]
VRAGAEHISQFTFGIHNIQCWHNACMAIAGYYLGDPDLVARAEEGAIGFHEQIEEGILEDGMWYERSMGYHYYTLNALIAHIEAARRNGKALHENDGIRRMFLVPLLLAQPNLVTPSLNDQGYTRGPINSDTLEVAVGWYDDDDARRALRELYENRGRSRSHIRALQYGEDLPESGGYQPPESSDLAGVGLAVLREGRGDAAVAAMLEYGEHGGGHGHPDKLQLILYGLGRTLMPDPGTTGYGVPLHREWFKTTPAHNTVTVGTNWQRATTAELIDFQTGDGWSSAAARSTGAYEGWELERRVLLTEDVLVDEFTVKGDAPDTLDWFARAPGGLSLSVEVEPITEDAPNATYGYLREMRGATTAEDWSAWWAIDDDGSGLHLTFENAPDTEAVTCLAPGLPGDDPWETLRVRRTAKETTFRVVYQMLADEEPEPVAFEPGRIRVGEMVFVRAGDGLQKR